MARRRLTGIKTLVLDVCAMKDFNTVSNKLMGNMCFCLIFYQSSNMNIVLS